MIRFVPKFLLAFFARRRRRDTLLDLIAESMPDDVEITIETRCPSVRFIPTDRDGVYVRQLLPLLLLAVVACTEATAPESEPEEKFTTEAVPFEGVVAASHDTEWCLDLGDCTPVTWDNSVTVDAGTGVVTVNKDAWTTAGKLAEYWNIVLVSAWTQYENVKVGLKTADGGIHRREVSYSCDPVTFNGGRVVGPSDIHRGASSIVVFVKVERWREGIETFGPIDVTDALLLHCGDGRAVRKRLGDITGTRAATPVLYFETAVGVNPIVDAHGRVWQVLTDGSTAEISWKKRRNRWAAGRDSMEVTYGDTRLGSSSGTAWPLTDSLKYRRTVVQFLVNYRCQENGSPEQCPGTERIVIPGEPKTFRKRPTTIS